MIHRGKSFSWGVTVLISGWYNICRVNVSHLPPFLHCSVSLANCRHHSSLACILSIPLWHLAHESGKVTNAHSTHTDIQRESAHRTHTHLHTCIHRNK